MEVSTSLLLCALIFWYHFLEDASTVESIVATMLETRSHPPGKNIKNEIYDYLCCLDDFFYILCLTLRALEFRYCIREAAKTYVTFKNTIILFVCPSKILHKHCFHFLQGLTMVRV